MTLPTPLPTLDELARNPARVAEIPPGQARALLLPASALVIALAARAGTPEPNGQSEGQGEARVEADRLLTPGEAGERLGVNPRWLYRHARSLPFTRRLSRKVLRFSEAGLRKWQAAKRA